MYTQSHPPIQYIGKLVVRLGAVGLAKTEIYPISSMNLVNRDLVLKLFKEWDALARKENPNMRDYALGVKFEKEGPLDFELGFYQFQKKVGFLSFEVYEESKLREKRDFLLPVA